MPHPLAFLTIVVAALGWLALIVWLTGRPRPPQDFPRPCHALT